jgi:hypothetical protein
MDNLYVGDGYPLCKELPNGAFLKKGATYYLLGSDSTSELLKEPDEWWGSAPIRFSLDKSSSLASILCNRSEGTNCSPSMKVVLESDVECFGLECNIEEPRVLEVEKGVWYEYVRSPCVNHAFYNDAKSIRRRQGELGFAMCGDPQSLAASTVCCEVATANDNTQVRSEVFSGERVKFESAVARCSGLQPSKSLCRDPFVTNNDCTENSGCDNYGTFYWSSQECSQLVKIDSEGKIAIIHQHHIKDVETNKMVTNDTQMFFRVDWLFDGINSSFSELTSECNSFGCMDSKDATCICPVNVNEVLAFKAETDIFSIDDILYTAAIAVSSNPEDSKFQPVKGIAGLFKYPADGLSAETVFRVIDFSGRTHYRKNVVSKVNVGDGTFSFRNPVSFFSLSDLTIRDAKYETDAVLEHAFYHPNISPFLAVRFAQRFGVSNPSPRYVSIIAEAFRSGEYTDRKTGMKFGSGRYGCLEATVAAVLLDSESLDPVLDKDPVQ